MGDDGIAWHLLERLRSDPRRPPGVELVWGGTDLLACADRLAIARGVLLVDAIAGEPRASPVLLDPLAAGLAERSPGAHSLGLATELRLLQLAEPALASVPMRLFGVPVAAVRAGPGLSPPLAARLPALVEAFLEALVESLLESCA